MMVMLPVHRLAHTGTDAVQVIGLIDWDTGYQWVVIHSDGRPAFVSFSELVFDGWLP